jgi:hypothetical protein
MAFEKSPDKVPNHRARRYQTELERVATFDFLPWLLPSLPASTDRSWPRSKWDYLDYWPLLPNSWDAYIRRCPLLRQLMYLC